MEAAERQTNSLALIDAIREAVGTVPGAEIKVEREEEGPPTGAPVSIELSGDDFEPWSSSPPTSSAPSRRCPGWWTCRAIWKVLRRAFESSLARVGS